MYSFGILRPLTQWKKKEMEKKKERKRVDVAENQRSEFEGKKFREGKETAIPKICSGSTTPIQTVRPQKPGKAKIKAKELEHFQGTTKGKHEQNMRETDAKGTQGDAKSTS